MEEWDEEKGEHEAFHFRDFNAKRKPVKDAIPRCREN
jgi:hypothetical protein